MKNLRGFILIAVAIVVAFFAAQLASRYFKKFDSGTTGILVAAARISPGDRLVTENLKIIKWSSLNAPPGSFYHIKDVTGRVAASIINKDEPINEKRLVPKEGITDQDLNGRIEPGMRAVSIKIGPASGVSGMLDAGDLVDVIAINSLGKNKKGWISRVILSGVKVLTVNYKKANPDRSKILKQETVILLLSLEDAQTLTASEGATLKLVKRNPFDKDRKKNEVTIFTASLGPKTMSDLQQMIDRRDRRMQEAILSGMRAVTIRVNDEDGICGYLRPGNKVDVIATHGFIQAAIHGRRLPGTEATVINNWLASKILMQNVEILFIEEDVAITGTTTPPQNGSDSSIDADRTDQSGEKAAVEWESPWPTKRVTLLLSPKDAERLTVIATTSAKVKLIVRKSEDSGIVETKGEKSNEIFFKEKDLYYDITIFGRQTNKGTKRFDRETLEEDGLQLSPRWPGKNLEI